MASPAALDPKGDAAPSSILGGVIILFYDPYSVHNRGFLCFDIVHDLCAHFYTLITIPIQVIQENGRSDGI